MTDTLTTLSNAMADAVAAAAPSVLQVQGRRRPASGLVYADGIVVTTMRAIGREDGLQVRRGDGETFAAELAGWDPTTGLGSPADTNLVDYLMRYVSPGDAVAAVNTTKPKPHAKPIVPGQMNPH